MVVLVPHMTGVDIYCTRIMLKSTRVLKGFRRKHELEATRTDGEFTRIQSRNSVSSYLIRGMYLCRPPRTIQRDTIFLAGVSDCTLHQSPKVGPQAPKPVPSRRYFGGCSESDHLCTHSAPCFHGIMLWKPRHASHPRLLLDLRVHRHILSVPGRFCLCSPRRQLSVIRRANSVDADRGDSTAKCRRRRLHDPLNVLCLVHPLPRWPFRHRLQPAPVQCSREKMLA